MFYDTPIVFRLVNICELYKIQGVIKPKSFVNSGATRCGMVCCSMTDFVGRDGRHAQGSSLDDQRGQQERVPLQLVTNIISTAPFIKVGARKVNKEVKGRQGNINRKQIAC